MKELCVAGWLILVSAVAAVGQGQFFFSNRDTTSGVTARIVAPSDTGTLSSIGSPDYVIQLFGGPIGSDQVPLDPPETGFRGPAGSALAGWVVPVTVTVPGVRPGEPAAVTLYLKGPSLPCLNPMTIVIPSLGGGVVTPPTLPMGAASFFGICPEPPPIVVITMVGLAASLSICSQPSRGGIASSPRGSI